MYTQWLFFPAFFGLATQFIDFGYTFYLLFLFGKYKINIIFYLFLILHFEFRSLQWLVLPAFFIFVISWAVFFLQFWKRKNLALLARLDT